MGPFPVRGGVPFQRFQIQILKEAGIAWTDAERLTGDTDGWRMRVQEKAYHVERWDRQRGVGCLRV